MSKNKLDQYVVFKLGKEIYSINIEHIVRILTDEKIRPVPNTSEEIRGIIHTEEDIAPVIDLRTKFAIKTDKPEEVPFIIICRVQEEYVVGLVVDEVIEVIEIIEEEGKESKIKPINLAHANISGKSTEYIQGIYRPRREEKVLDQQEVEDLFIVLDVNKLLELDTYEELDAIKDQYEE